MKSISHTLGKFCLFLITCIAFNACTQQKKDTKEIDKMEIEQVAADESIPFDEEKWKFKEGRRYPFRDKMLPNMVFNEELRSLRSDEIVEVLGEPERIDNNHYFYRIDDNKIGAWTLHSKTLVIKYDKDSTLVWMKIHE